MRGLPSPLAEKLSQIDVAVRQVLKLFLKVLGRLKYLSRISTSQQVDMFMPLYRCGSNRVYRDFGVSPLGEVTEQMATIERVERELIKKVRKVEKDMSRDSETLNQIESALQEDCTSNASFELMYHGADSIDAVLHDRITEIQCVVDRVREYTELRKFYAMKQATEDAIFRIQAFHAEFSYPVPLELFTTLGIGINTHLFSLEKMRLSIQKVIDLRAFPNSSSTSEVLMVWSESLEAFTEEFKDNQEFFSYEVFCYLGELATQIVLQCHPENLIEGGSEKEHYHTKVYNAASFLLDVIKASQEEADEEDEEVISSLSRMSALTLNDMLSGEEGGSCHSQDRNKN